MKGYIHLVMTAGLALTASHIARAGDIGAEQLVNGDFSAPITTGWAVEQYGAPAVNEAVVSTSAADPAFAAGFDKASAPTSFAAFNPSLANVNGGYITQSFQTVAGTNYEISFNFGDYGAPNGKYDSTMYAVLDNGSASAHAFLAYPTPQHDFATLFYNETYFFTGTGAIWTLSIGDFTAKPGTTTLLVSNAQVLDVPEPLSLALFGSAVLAVGVARRRRLVRHG